jgi:hypothetical protein
VVKESISEMGVPAGWDMCVTAEEHVIRSENKRLSDNETVSVKLRKCITVHVCIVSILKAQMLSVYNSPLC